MFSLCLCDFVVNSLFFAVNGYQNSDSGAWRDNGFLR